MLRIETRRLLLIVVTLLCAPACAAEISDAGELGEEEGGAEHSTEAVASTSEALRVCEPRTDGIAGQRCDWGHWGQNERHALSSPNGCVFDFQYGNYLGVMYSKAMPDQLTQICTVYAVIEVVYPTKPNVTFYYGPPDGWSTSATDWSEAQVQPGYGGGVWGAHVYVQSRINPSVQDVHYFMAL